MAEGGVSEEGLEETSKETQECSICFSEFKEPRLLECSHRFCLKCLQELQAAQNEDDKKIVCPLCRKETILPEGGVDKLPCSQEGANKEEDQDGDQVPKVICQACDEENEALSRCMDCEHYLCKECQKAHQRWVAFKKHKIATLEELGPDGKLKDYVPMCKEHPKQEVCLYCNSCDVLICHKCASTDHKPSTHFHSNIDEAFNKCKQEINDAVTQTKQCVQEFAQTNPLATKYSRQRLATHLRRTKIEISIKAEKEIAKIRQKEQQLRQGAEDIFKERDTEFAYPVTAGHVVSKVNRVVTTSSCYEVLESKTELLQDLREQVQFQKRSSINHTKSFLGFKESHDAGELGSLLLGEKWENISTIEKQNTHFAAYSTNDVVWAGRGRLDFSKRQFSWKNRGEMLKLVNPVAVAKYGNTFIVLDGREVKTADENHYHQLHAFKPATEANIVGTPTCLAVGLGGTCTIAVGYKGKDMISIHNADGYLVKTLPAPKVGHHLAISYERLIYTNTDYSTTDLELRCIDFDGKEIFKNVKCGGRLPGLVCCDDTGNIYVAVSGVIKQFSEDGTYLDTLMCDGLKNPTDMKFSPEGDLLVLSEGCLWKYERV